MSDEEKGPSRIAQLLARDAKGQFDQVKTRFEIGQCIAEAGGDDRIPEIHAELLTANAKAWMPMLYDAHRVYRTLKSIDTLRSIHKRLGGLSWGFVVNHCTKAPEGDGPEARAYWDRVVGDAVNALGKFAHLASNFDHLPESIQDDIAGIVAAMAPGHGVEQPLPKGPFRFAHTADTQFCQSMSFAGIQKIDPGTGRNIRLLDQTRCLQFVVDEAVARDCWALVHAGDGHEDAISTPNEQAMVLSVLVPYSRRRPVIFLLGNHDMSKEPFDASALEYLKGRPNIYVIERPTILWQCGLDIHYEQPENWDAAGHAKYFCLPYPSKALCAGEQPDLSMEELNELASNQLRLIIEDFRMQLDPRVPNILVFHLSIEGSEGAEDDRKTQFNPSLRPSDLRGFTYCAGGHLHKMQQIADNACYSGSHDRMNFSEENDKKGFLVVEFAEDGLLKVDPVYTPARRFQTLSPDLFLDPDWKQSLEEDVIYRVKGDITREQAVALQKHLQEFPFPYKDDLRVVDATRVRDESMTIDVTDDQAILRVAAQQGFDAEMAEECLRLHYELVAEEKAVPPTQEIQAAKTAETTTEVNDALQASLFKA